VNFDRSQANEHDDDKESEESE
jgi:hypothetical protein